MFFTLVYGKKTRGWIQCLFQGFGPGCPYHDMAKHIGGIRRVREEYRSYNSRLISRAFAIINAKFKSNKVSSWDLQLYMYDIALSPGYTDDGVALDKQSIVEMLHVFIRNPFVPDFNHKRCTDPRVRHHSWLPSPEESQVLMQVALAKIFHNGNESFDGTYDDGRLLEWSRGLSPELSALHTLTVTNLSDLMVDHTICTHPQQSGTRHPRTIEFNSICEEVVRGDNGKGPDGARMGNCDIIAGILCILSLPGSGCLSMVPFIDQVCIDNQMVCATVDSFFLPSLLALISFPAQFRSLDEPLAYFSGAYLFRLHVPGKSCGQEGPPPKMLMITSALLVAFLMLAISWYSASE